MKKYQPKVFSTADFDARKTEYQTFQQHDFFRDLLFEQFLTGDVKKYYASPAEQEQEFEQFWHVHSNDGYWIAHDWNKSLYHLPSMEDYYHLRTVRNKNIVSLDDQNVLRNQIIAIAGLSVGSNILLALLRYGIGHTYRIADNDVIAVSNFNRTTFDLRSFNQSKTNHILKSINAIDPFISTEIFSEGLTEENVSEFITDASIIIDTFDNFGLKIALRKEAKKQKIPVISGFDIEKGVLLIVERYDQEPDLNLSLFLNNHTEEEITRPVANPQEKTKLFIDIIGKELHSSRMIDSVMAVGQTLTGFPQLVIATLLAASLFTSTIEDILLQRTKGSLRKYVSYIENPYV